MKFSGISFCRSDKHKYRSQRAMRAERLRQENEREGVSAERGHSGTEEDDSTGGTALLSFLCSVAESGPGMRSDRFPAASENRTLNSYPLI